ncbi:hypothetical protein I79_010676 [Cricetulus griseus]|uniref:Uncharacterized protein n=1 Tax=Cricetulus griseus TaxID=10029 RepID=G3HJ42_CRIGR|nr:hypothetical protein I79_010676 [Cricetulus griseus]
MKIKAQAGGNCDSVVDHRGVCHECGCSYTDLYMGYSSTKPAYTKCIAKLMRLESQSDFDKVLPVSVEGSR